VADIASAVPGKHIVLLGMIGVGKTTIGAGLAAHLDLPFIDSDDVLRPSTGRNAAEIAADDGVDALHAIEGETLLSCLGRHGSSVIAAAASVIESPRCRAALADHTCLWFDADAATLAARQKRAEHRRELDDTEAELAALKRRRDPLYASLALVRVDTAATDPDGALAAAREALGSAGSRPV
jgi:shikimate kinase